MGTLKDRILFCGIWGHDQQIGASFHLQCCPLVSAGELRQCCPGLAASWLLRWNPGTSEGGLRQWSPEPVGFQLLVKIRFKKVFNSFQRKTYHSVSAIRRKNSACYWTCIWSFFMHSSSKIKLCFCNSKSSQEILMIMRETWNGRSLKGSSSAELNLTRTELFI